MNSALKKILIAGGSIALIIFSINAFAHSGMGWGHHGPGWNHHIEYYGNAERMTPEEYEQFEKKREAFFNETQSIRNELYGFMAGNQVPFQSVVIRNYPRKLILMWLSIMIFKSFDAFLVEGLFFMIIKVN